MKAVRQGSVMRLVLAATCALAGHVLSAASYLSTPGARCEVRSGHLSGASGCVDLDGVSGGILRVPSSVTRISKDGLVVCGMQVAAKNGTDIAYIIDQSASMVPSSFLVDNADTIVYTSCMYGFGTQTPFRGFSLMQVDPSTETDAKRYCVKANDPYNRRISVVQDAMTLQSSLSSGSYAGWVSFGDLFHVSDMENLSDPTAKNQLLQSMKLDRLGGTIYRDPIGWARVMLQGGHQSANPQNSKAASPNPRKAIIMISDGEPNDTATYLNAIKPRATIADTNGVQWVVDADSAPAIYGIFLSLNSNAGVALNALAQRTGGKFMVIPPDNPDSLKRVIARIVGGLLLNANPDSFRITNKTNGQVSVAVSSSPEGGGTRMRLDSIVGLSKGRNDLEIRATLGTSSAKTIQWTVVVGDSASQFSSSGTDSLLMAACTDVSRISLRPGSDTSRLFADGRDTSLAFQLDVSNAGQVRLPTNFVSVLSKDSGSAAKVLAQSPTTPRIASDGLLSWRLGSAIRTDAIVQTGTGWDTVRMVYRTPRDPRDSAVATLPVLHPRPARIWFSPDTVGGTAGSLQVNLLDSLQVPDTALVVVTHRLGDTIRVILKRTSGAIFQAIFSFAQGSSVTRGDGVLQTGPLRQIKLDSVFAVRGTLRDTAILRAPVPQLRFADSLGRPGDSLSATILDPGSMVRVRVGMFLGDSLLSLSDSISITLPSWLEALTVSASPNLKGVRLVSGRTEFWVRGVATGTGGMLQLRNLDRPDTLFGGPISVSVYRLVFVTPSGDTTTSWPVDRKMGSTESVEVRVVGKNGLCTQCSGVLRLTPGVGLYANAPTGGGVRVAGGEASFVIGAVRPVDGGRVSVAFDSLSLSLVVQPIRFQAPPPDSAIYEDRDGDGGVDRVRVYFQIPWNAGNRLVFPWPGAGQNLDLSKATYQPSADSLTLDIALGSSQAIPSTAWSTAPQWASWSWSASDTLQTFRVIERIAPVPLRARILRGSTWDTLVVFSSEPLAMASIKSGADLVHKLAPSFPALPSVNVSWSSSDRSLRFVYPSNTIDGIVVPGDSVRFSPGGAVRDTQGSVPGTVARAVVVQGVDRGPLSALVTDSDADGRADRITLRFSTAPRWTDRYVFRWPDGKGGIDKRTIDASLAMSDSGGRILSFLVDPFSFGVTSCPAGGCIGFGSMESSRYGDTIRASLDEQDGVVPVIVKAALSFGLMDGDADTVRFTFSEPVDHRAGAPWVRWGRPSIDSLGDTIVRLADPVWNGRVVQYLVDTSFHGVWGDSVRIGAWPNGGVSDSVGNGPGRFAHWSPLEMGETVSRLRAMAWPSLVKYDGWTVPVSEPGLTLLVRPTSRDIWKTLGGKAPTQDLSHYVGIRILSNKDLDAASLYVYDHMGIFVGHIYLTPLLEQMRGRSSGKTLRGDYEILVAWNGKDADGRMVPSGPYLARVMAWQGFGHNRKLVHWIFKIGWKIWS